MGSSIKERAMRGWRTQLVLLLPVLVLPLVAGCGQTSVTTLDAEQLSACQVTASDLAFTAPSFTGLPTTAGLGGKSLTIDGSTALYPLFQALAPAFDQANGTKTTVGQGGSVTGLDDVESGKVQVGMSDLFYQNNASSKGYTDLVDHRVAAVTFALAVNGGLKNTVHNLATKQIQAIYSGTVLNWRQLGGPDVPITVIERPPTSGTRASFETYVLGVAPSTPTNAGHALNLTKDSSDLVAHAIAVTPGSIGYVATGYITEPAYSNSIFPICIDAQPPTEASINAGSYRFWNYEHAYTKGAPSPVEQAFLTAVTSATVQQSLVPAKGFLRIDQLSSAATATHPLPAGSE
jgi:phosphate transport system substrate-binding protein